MIKPELFRRKGLTPAIKVTGTPENIKAIEKFTELAVGNYPDNEKVSVQSDPAVYINYGDYLVEDSDAGWIDIQSSVFEDMFIVEV